MLISHQALRAFLMALDPICRFRPGEVVLAANTLAFDLSVLEVFLPGRRRSGAGGGPG